MAIKKKKHPENKVFLDKILSRTGVTLSELARHLKVTKQDMYQLYHGFVEVKVKKHLVTIRPFSGMKKQEYMKHISESFEI